jgi:hypothetical protein
MGKIYIANSLDQAKKMLKSSLAISTKLNQVALSFISLQLLMDIGNEEEKKDLQTLFYLQLQKFQTLISNY